MEATESQFEEMQKEVYQLKHFDFTASQFIEERKHCRINMKFILTKLSSVKACILDWSKSFFDEYKKALFAELSNDLVLANVYMDSLENTRHLLENKMSKACNTFEVQYK